MSNSVTVAENNAVMTTYTRFPITLTEGKGSFVWDDQGAKYLDYTAGIATCNLGHRPATVQAAVEEQLNKLWHCSNLYHIPKQDQLAELLVDQTCFDQVFFANSGAEANEGAIKLARRYAHKIKQTDQFEIVTFTDSFHGRTLATMSATGQPKIQDGYAPHMPGFRYARYNDEKEFAQLIQPKTIAVMLELVQGEGGVIPADQAWVDQLVTLCRQHGVLIIVDEIQTGMGRLGSLFAYQQYGFEPDIMTVAKGLASGFPVGAVLAKADISTALTPGSHGSTFGGNPLAMSAGLATLAHICEPAFFESVSKQQQYLWQQLNVLAEQAEDIVEIRGSGFLIGIKVSTKAIDYVNKARAAGLLILVAGPQVIRILPPLNTTKQEIDQACKILNALFLKNEVDNY
ncbi:acetylornithine aminotransferase [Amphibacillus marinus]|uniref:Acetylornithine aminotransferase n=1 Tax=Amphibacillus marinus TaxID=872970 RepID=A0A1H8MII9_9BACI|nr:acetylornithine transaminase [Amphibacillus marinus]SEO17104.1 acetylornithine aminotransferase [Amphibacillus marinus]